MDPNIEKLLQIQDKDTRIANLTKQINTVPIEKQQIQDDMAAAEDIMEDAKQAIMTVEKRIKTVEMEIGSLNQRKDDLQAKSHQIKKNDEYRAMLKEVEAFDTKISKFEDLQLEEMEALEAAREKRAEAKKKADAAKRRLAGTIEDLDVRAKNCEQQVKKVQAERDELAKDVPEELMRLYDRLTARSQGTDSFEPAVAPLIDNNCGKCFLSVTPNVRHRVNKGEVISCENCGVILYPGE